MSKTRSRSTSNKRVAPKANDRRTNSKQFNNMNDAVNHLTGQSKNPILKSHNERQTRMSFQPVKLVPRNKTQRHFLDLLENNECAVCAAIGPAGTGKTFIAALYAIKQLLDQKIERIIITRPAVSVDEDHGFLPGTLEQKMAPWTRPIFDLLREYFCKSDIDHMLKEEIIEISPLAYMRGRSFSNCIILGDEMQLTTPNQMKMLLTRIGEGSKLILTGDLKQADRLDDNGLSDFINKVKSNTKKKNIALVEFGHHEIERSQVVQEVLELYGEED